MIVLFQKVIGDGAITVAVAGQLPTGCVPLFLTLFASSNKLDYESDTKCLKAYNDLATYHNLLLVKELGQLRSKYPHTNIIYTNYYDPVISIVKHPDQFGNLSIYLSQHQLCILHLHADDIFEILQVLSAHLFKHAVEKTVRTTGTQLKFVECQVLVHVRHHLHICIGMVSI